MAAILLLKIGNGQQFEISQKIPNVEFLSATDTPAISNNYNQFTAIDSSFFNFSTINQNTYTVKLMMDFGNYGEYKSLRYDVYKLFVRKDYIQMQTDSELPFIRFVRAVGFDIEPFVDGAHSAIITIPFENPSGFKFSRKKSDEQDDLWDYFPLGWDIPEFVPGQFEYKNNGFKVYNPSNVEIDPYYQKSELRIFIKYKGDSLELVNTSNNSKWKLNRKSSGTDQVILDGINATFNNEPCGKDTDFGNISLNKGWNQMQVNGATAFDIRFSFPFVYV